MNNIDLEERYLEWLYFQVGNPRAKGFRNTYWVLMRQLFTTEFVWSVPNDDNRVEDGKDLRYEFLVETQAPYVHQEFMDIGCSVLEMMIALARRVSFLTDTPVESWFWHMLNNLGLSQCNDASGDFTQHVDNALEALIFRTYDPSGRGGLFPLRRPDKDQTQVEIWYQMGAYILENS